MIARHRSIRPLAGLLAVALAATTVVAGTETSSAQVRVRRSYARASVHRSAAVNVNRNVNVNVHADYHYDRWGHPIARAAAFTAAAVAVGTIVASLPPNCSTVVAGAVTYHNCGGVYYQPTYQGTTVQYVVVDHP